MPKRYSPEIRRTALEFVNQGQTQIEVAQALGVNPKTLELGRGRGISNLGKKARITRPAPLI